MALIPTPQLDAWLQQTDARLAALEKQPTPPPIGGLVLTLTGLASGPLTFSQSAATDVGDYVGQFVHQKCLKQRQGDWTVFFRPDANGSRDEVVVELGTVRSTTPAHILTPYTATITKNGATLATVQVPVHWWWSRWRWFSAARALVRKPADLIASKALLPHTTKYLYGWPGWGVAFGGLTYTYSGPMDTAGLDVAVGAGGDRPEIGPITIPQADYVVNGTPAALSSMMAQAEASGSMPVHYRDETTGAFVNVQTTPYWTTLPASGGPVISEPAIPRDAAGNVLPNFFLMDASHAPALTYLPYLLTDDPYYLEALQAIATFHIVWSSYHNQVYKLPGLVYPGEPRAFAWGARSEALAAYVTPATVPGWLGAQSYWKQNLADSRAFLKLYQTSPALVHTLFHAFTRSDSQQGFMADYIAIVLAWIVRLGFMDWLDGYQWFMGGVLPQVSDGSGWTKGWPDPYWFFFLTTDSTGSGTPTLLVPDNSQDANTYPSWTALFQRYVTDKGNTGDPTLGTYPPAWDGVSIAQVNTPLYFVQRSGALHLAIGLSLSGVSAPSAWLDSQVQSKLTPAGATGDPRWSLDVTF